MPVTRDNKEKKYITRIRKKAQKSAGVDTSKYCGTVKFYEDALVIQKRLRDEWK
jgi:hypothetical protein